MLSIITCSVDKLYLKQLQKNIEETIGIDYEHLVFDNIQYNWGICKVYNSVAPTAKFPYLLFLHEDVLFKTKDWGKYLLECFQTNEAPSVIGVAGSNYKSKSFSGWYTALNAFDSYHIIHNVNGGIENMITVKNDMDKLYPAVCIDGVFIACKKEVYNEIEFNEQQLKGFHFYDLDFSLRASEKYQIAITLNIVLEHITQGGDFGDKWIKEAIHFHNYMNNKLPVPLKITNQKKIDQSIIILWLDFLKSQKISFSNRIAWVSKQQLPINAKLIYPIIKFFLYDLLNLKVIHNLIKNIKRKN